MRSHIANKKPAPPTPTMKPRLVVDNSKTRRGPEHRLIAKVMFVTVTLAKEWMTHNHPDQKPIRRKQLAKYMRAMTRGSWRLSHQAICFDKNGYLIDGQHRLMAIIESGVELYMLVVWNEDADIHDPIDCGGGRPTWWRIGETPRMGGAVQMLLQMECGDSLSQTTQFTQDELLDGVKNYAECNAALEQLGIKKNDLVSPLRAAILWAMPINRRKVLDWARKFHTGAGLEENSAVLTFRNWFNNEVKGERVLPSYIAFAALSSIRHHILGVPMTKVFSTTDIGYRAACAKRRQLGVHRTPSTDLVASDVQWTQPLTDARKSDKKGR